MSTIVLGAVDVKQKMKYYKEVMHKAPWKHKGEGFLQPWGNLGRLHRKGTDTGCVRRRGQAERGTCKRQGHLMRQGTLEEPWELDMGRCGERGLGSVARDEAGSQSQMWPSTSLLVVRLKNKNASKPQLFKQHGPPTGIYNPETDLCIWTGGPGIEKRWHVRSVKKGHMI